MSSPFAEKVYALVAQVPRGCVTTYGSIARVIGHPRAAKVVGQCMRRTTERRGLPCHRVVNARGELAPNHVFGSQEDQRLLLEMEGVTFLPDGKIDLKRHLWHGTWKN